MKLISIILILLCMVTMSLSASVMLRGCGPTPTTCNQTFTVGECTAYDKCFEPFAYPPDKVKYVKVNSFDGECSKTSFFITSYDDSQCRTDPISTSNEWCVTCFIKTNNTHHIMNNLKFGYYAVLVSLAMGIFYSKSIKDNNNKGTDSTTPPIVDKSSINCVFCQIIQEDKKAVYQDEELFIFSDRTPKASTHLLVIPKRHIKSVKTLTVDDLPILVKMKQVAIEYANREHYGKKYHLGYHIPPFYSIPHLHMHLLVEPFTPARKRISYTPHLGGLWFKDVDTIINSLADQVV
ncbi:hypothetical protein DFA_00137 [Cavenderia fasciculata]|uniref:HIT domain-containing protein n=1 Tax=Cavenderia fasciculata TaxID=261658 RepID=F4PXP9_CACFS|nr:uncharacterized protein DFA_00137 [Cavenderia fasciculata]EGG19559.1 hypothetical protein DFA_00137 [Cavenderia fasciculata]|eukprot:XP_004357853.1 hypothetical protein DFA_00137 [Cavenderia fasciculata]